MHTLERTRERTDDGHRGTADGRYRPGGGGLAGPRFRILGLLHVQGRDHLMITARRQQVLLAVLLLNANRVVPLDSLVDELWGCVPPVTARAQVQTCVSALRRGLSHAGLGERIRTRGAGYALELVPEELDLKVFERLLGQGREALAAGRPQAARTAFREALALWRGELLTGIDSRAVRAHRVRVAERRTEAVEDCIEAELRLGLHRELVGELSALVDEYPLRERFVAQLMTALHRCGRRVEALAAYRKVRETFVEELGLDPGPALFRLHQDILTGRADPGPVLAGGGVPPGPGTVTGLRAGPGPATAAGGPVPRMLPPRVSCFTGRTEVLNALRRRLTAGRGLPGTSPVAVLTGRSGVGKSAVAVEAAHDLAPEFPDGQLYARMTGPDGRPADTAEVLERFLRALGVPAAEIPADPDGRAACYRSTTAGRRLLIVLDDAADETQIRPLLPSTPAGRLLMTARARSAAPTGAAVLELDVLPTREALALLAAVAGPDRVAAEEREARELAGLCGGLQIALRGAAARLAARPHWTFAHLVARARSEHHRLDELGGQGIDVRAALHRGYHALPPEARLLHARLALLEPPGPSQPPQAPGFPEEGAAPPDAAVSGAWTWGAWLAGPLLDLEAGRAADALEALVDARLVDVAHGTGAAARCRMHELSRVFARERLLGDSARQERTQALRRVFGAWLFLADEARARLGTGPAHGPRGAAGRWPLARPVTDEVLAEPASWYARERPALLAAVRQAAGSNAVRQCWNLVVAVAGLSARQRPGDWRECAVQALHAARRSGDRIGEAVIRDLLDHGPSRPAARREKKEVAR
ncbi:transcriptional regulator [Streptomyces aidingensis]|uniref:DNA-binding transcriptional activator of the SARP family n=1 Tax=Streptomyces aidingensis TaxID=910347 RepID=A0A1I1MR67_9ACTN|nr:transcriptional regulator [Streptomyces aidingensis]SFC87859.1 DNA-binding transcriptional activator of the SARP family [Streptomyces aidingensis]